MKRLSLVIAALILGVMVASASARTYDVPGMLLRMSSSPRVGIIYPPPAAYPQAGWIHHQHVTRFSVRGEPYYRIGPWHSHYIGPGFNSPLMGPAWGPMGW